jgi:mRNA interferase MazF
VVAPDVRYGEVWWSEDEQLGRRPVLVLSRPAVLPVLARPLVAPLTTRVRGLPTEVALDVDDGLPQPCVVSLDNVQPLAAALLVERITQLSPAHMQAVCRALAVATNC